jgi:hypothetical protein
MIIGMVYSRCLLLEPVGLWVLVRSRGKAARGKLMVRLTYEFQGGFRAEAAIQSSDRKT